MESMTISARLGVGRKREGSFYDKKPVVLQTCFASGKAIALLPLLGGKRKDMLPGMASGGEKRPVINMCSTMTASLKIGKTYFIHRFNSINRLNNIQAIFRTATKEPQQGKTTYIRIFTASAQRIYSE